MGEWTNFGAFQANYLRLGVESKMIRPEGGAQYLAILKCGSRLVLDTHDRGGGGRDKEGEVQEDGKPRQTQENTRKTDTLCPCGAMPCLPADLFECSGALG